MVGKPTYLISLVVVCKGRLGEVGCGAGYKRENATCTAHDPRGRRRIKAVASCENVQLAILHTAHRHIGTVACIFQVHVLLAHSPVRGLVIARNAQRLFAFEITARSLRSRAYLYEVYVSGGIIDIETLCHAVAFQLQCLDVLTHRVFVIVHGGAVR